MLKPILRQSHVDKQFAVGDQRITVLKDINLTFHAGVMVAIVGTSGSGKSTLMNILGCLDRPSSGRYEVGKRDTGSLRSDELAKLRCRYFGFVFQRYHQLANLTALENVAMPAIYAGTPAGERQAGALRLLRRLGLDERADHRPHQLSGGQQQRVGIARAIINGSKVILADEPTGALDTETGQETMRLLLDLHAQGHTVIIVTHDRAVADYANARHPALPAPTTQRRSKRRGGRQRRAGLSGLKRLTEAFAMARLALASHRLRTALTMLGIVIGIAAVVSIMAIGEGGQRHIRETIGPLASNRVEIRRGSGWGDSQAAGVHTLLPGDVASLAEQSYVDGATPMTQGSFTVRYGNAAASAVVTGVGESYFAVRGVVVARGRAFQSEDIRRQAQVVVITEATRRSLFGYRHFASITVRLREGQDSRLAEKNIFSLLSYRHGAKDFFTDNMATLAEAYERTTRSVSLMLSLVASIALLVGGLLGVLLSLLSGQVFGLFVSEWQMVFGAGPVVLAFLCSTLIGVSFGYLPARKASRLQPHDALARESSAVAGWIDRRVGRAQRNPPFGCSLTGRAVGYGARARLTHPTKLMHRCFDDRHHDETLPGPARTR